jgi:hypothetical protein
MSGRREKLDYPLGEVLVGCGEDESFKKDEDTAEGTKR